MKVKDVPQDLKYYKDTIVRDVNYAVDENGEYKAVLSGGWDPKTEALDMAWDEIKEKCREIAERVKKGESSPLEYHLARNIMSVKLMAKYTGLRRHTIRKHLKPKYFNQLDDATLETYANALRISVEELKSLPQIDTKTES